MTDIEKLEELIIDIYLLLFEKTTPFSPGYREWYCKANRFIRNKYGVDSIEYNDFCENTSFHHELNPLYTVLLEKECRDNLMVIKSLFDDYLQEMKQQDPLYIEKDMEPYEMEYLEPIERIFTRFCKVARQLTHRHDGRETLRITDEYDVQDLLRALLSLYYDDVRPEEPTPSHAGSSLRSDFLIPEIEAVIEVKKTRPTMTDKTLSEELIVDIEKYQAHPICKKIYCFVYDPDMILHNPAAIKNDLEKKHEGLVRVFIES